MQICNAPGKSTGVVTNTGITHATPASAYANSVSRNYEKDTDIIFPSQECTDIAAQLIEKGHDIEVSQMNVGNSKSMKNIHKKAYCHLF